MSALTGVKCYICHTHDTSPPTARSERAKETKGTAKEIVANVVKVTRARPKGKRQVPREDVGTVGETTSRRVAHPWRKGDK